MEQVRNQDRTRTHQDSNLSNQSIISDLNHVVQSKQIADFFDI